MAQAPKELIFEEAARGKLRKGVDELADVVGVTLGPKGRHVGLQASWGAPNITKDGNSVVKDIENADQYVNMGVSLGKEAAAKMKEKCGDGTTSTILLLRALVREGVKNIASNATPIYLKRGIDKAVEAIIAELDKIAIQVKPEEIRSIASAAASGNSEVGNFIAEAFQKTGKAGVITIEEGKSLDTQIEMVDGMQFDRGYVSAYFCTNVERMLVEMQNVRILITDKKISSIQEILPILQETAASGAELLIIADEIEGDALSTLVVNRLRGILKVCAVKAPGFGDRREAMLEDLAILTGATFMSEKQGLALKNATAEVLGAAEKIVVTKDKTLIVNGKGAPKAIQARAAVIDAEMKVATNTYDKEKLEERKAKLSGGVAVIRVGAATEPEMKQKKQLFEDSLNSTKAALEEGIVTGGGIALLRARPAIASLKLDCDEQIGADIVFKACEILFRQIASNGGHMDSSLLLEEVLKKDGKQFGFNVQTGQIEDLYKAGVMDPVKVVKNALRFAASTAGLILLSEVLIGNAPEEEATDTGS